MYPLPLRLKYYKRFLGAPQYFEYFLHKHFFIDKLLDCYMVVLLNCFCNLLIINKLLEDFDKNCSDFKTNNSAIQQSNNPTI
jgi:hypothetical protein